MSIVDASVATERKEYKEYLPIWDQVDDCVKGQKFIKDKGEAYLPKPDAENTTKANQKRYSQYLARALFMNATARTLSAMVGVVYSKPAVIELPSNLEYLLDNADGNGLGIEQHSRGSVEENVKKGRHGLFVDFPATDGVSTKQQQREMDLRPYIIKYNAQDIINWRTKRVGAVEKLCMVVLKEKNDVFQGFYESDVATTYRVLWLDGDGYYNVTVMNLIQDKDKIVVDDKSVNHYEPKDANGNRLNFIPFRFVGSRDNDYRIDEAPLYDLSSVNISHYQNSADNEESSFICGQPTLVLSTASSEQELTTNNPQGIKVGSRSAIILGQGDSANFLQADPNNLPFSNMQRKEEMMVELGARLVSPSKQQTAEAARINYGAETSQLATIVTNENEAYGDCIAWCSLYENGDAEPDFTFELNTNFFHEGITAQEITAWLSAVQAGKLPNEDFLRRMKAAGQISKDREIEDMQDELEAQEPTIGSADTSGNQSSDLSE
jgi:hypothetical protein